MEIAPRPRRPMLSVRARVWAVLVVFVPVFLLALLPAGLGISQYVMNSSAMAGSIDKGAVVYVRTVPAGDLQVGDVISFRPPDRYATDGRVTRRIVGIDDQGLVTRGDGNQVSDPWLLDPTRSRDEVVFHLPWVGYPFMGVAERALWIVLLLLPALVVLLTGAFGDGPRPWWRPRRGGRTASVARVVSR